MKIVCPSTDMTAYCSLLQLTEDTVCQSTDMTAYCSLSQIIEDYR